MLTERTIELSKRTQPLNEDIRDQTSFPDYGYWFVDISQHRRSDIYWRILTCMWAMQRWLGWFVNRTSTETPSYSWKSLNKFLKPLGTRSLMTSLWRPSKLLRILLRVQANRSHVRMELKPFGCGSTLAPPAPETAREALKSFDLSQCGYVNLSDLECAANLLRARKIFEIWEVRTVWCFFIKTWV